MKAFLRKQKRKIKSAFFKEKFLWEKNKDEISAINKKTLALLSLIMGLLALGMFFVSFFSLVFYELKTGYFVVAVCFLASYGLSFLKKDRVPVIVKMYFAPAVLFAFALYTSLMVAPDTISVLILGFFCVLGLTFLDRNFRVLLFMLGFLGVYIAFSIPLKPDNIVMEDIFNALGFATASFILGMHLRKIQFENIDMRRQQKELANTDALTGLYNRQKLSELLDAGQRHQNISMVAMVDIDYYKNYNDAYGHQAGDACLVEVAGILLAFTQKYLMNVYRYGGEEFLIIIHKDESSSPKTLFEELRIAIEQTNIPHEQSPFKRVTISAGYTTTSIDSLLAQRISEADKAMYFAKKSGRNRVCSFEESNNQS